MRKILWLALLSLGIAAAQPATVIMVAITATRIMNALKSADSGTANAYAGCDTATTAPVDGLIVMLTPANTNTGASTLNWCAAGAKAIQSNLGAAISAGVIQANGSAVPSHILFVYSTAANSGAGAWGIVGSGGTSSGGASAIYQLSDAVCARTSGTVATCSFPAGATNFGTNGYSIPLSTTWTVTVTTVASGTTFYLYWNPASPGTISVDTSASSFSGLASCNAGCTLVNTSVTGYPHDVKIIGRLTAANSTANQFDPFSSCQPSNASGCIDDRALLSLSVVNGGGPMVTTYGSNGIKTVTPDTTVLAQKFFLSTGTPTGSGALASNLPGDITYLTATPYTVWECLATQGTAAPACTSVTAGGWTVAGGGSSTAKVPIWDGPFGVCGDSAAGAEGWMNGWNGSQASNDVFCSNTSGTTGNPPPTAEVGLTNASGQNISYMFAWDISITAVDLHFIFAQSSTSAGNFRFVASLLCNTLGTSIRAGTWTQGSLSTTSTITAPGAANTGIAVNITGIAIPTCAANSPMVLNLTRDQTVASNDGDDARLYTGSIIVTRTLP